MQVTKTNHSNNKTKGQMHKAIALFWHQKIWAKSTKNIASHPQSEC